MVDPAGRALTVWEIFHLTIPQHGGVPQLLSSDLCSSTIFNELFFFFPLGITSEYIDNLLGSKQTGTSSTTSAVSSAKGATLSQALAQARAPPAGRQVLRMIRPAPPKIGTSVTTTATTTPTVTVRAVSTWCDYDFQNTVKLKCHLHLGQGSHSTLKTWKNESTPGKPRNIMEFWKISIKIMGKWYETRGKNWVCIKNPPLY